VKNTRPQKKTDQRTSEEEIWKKICGQQVSSRPYNWRKMEAAGGSTKQIWMERNGLWLMFHSEQQNIAHSI